MKILIGMILMLVITGIMLIIMPDHKIIEYKHELNKLVHHHYQEIMNNDTTITQQEGTTK